MDSIPTASKCVSCVLAMAAPFLLTAKVTAAPKEADALNM